MSHSVPVRRLAATLFAVLSLATVGTLALTQELRSRPDVINTVRIRPLTADRPGIVAFNLTQRERSGTVTVLGPKRLPIAALALDQPLGPGRVRLEWDGTMLTGIPAPPGNYAVRFDLDKLERAALLPGRIRVEEEQE